MTFYGSGEIILGNSADTRAEKFSLKSRMRRPVSEDHHWPEQNFLTFISQKNIYKRIYMDISWKTLIIRLVLENVGRF